jgi:glycosyltransferase involved in cell wall biosynthesis
MSVKNICVVVPAKNEAASVGVVVSGIIEHFDLPVIVVDDCSDDATGPLAEQAGAVVLRTPCSLGAWGATQTGLKFGLIQGYTQFVTCDADLQHNFNDIPQLLKELEGGDVVIGSCPQRGSAARHIAWSFFKTLSGLEISDLTSGFRAYSYPAARLLSGHKATLFDYQDIGVLMLLAENSMKIKEIEVTMAPREDGASRIFSSWWKVSEYMVLTTLYILARKLTSGFK